MIQTKLQCPYTHEKLVQRRHLVQRLNENSERKLMLVLASAGYGKTTLVTSWLDSQDDAFCWVSLAENDNDPIQFWSYVIAALQTVSPEVGKTSLPILRNSPSTAVSVLVNDIATHCSPDKPFFLVLDDYHEISESSIHQDLIFLLTHSLPCLRVVITSRVDPPFPLPRWRVRGFMSEIRDADLRFTEAEATVFLNELLELNLTSEDVAALEKRTEGWVASLKLAGLAMQSPTVKPQDRHDFVSTFTGSDRYIVDYLLEEVLQQQQPHIQEFLLETAVLDRFCAPLCEAVLSDKEHAASETLHYLDQANLFLIPLDNQRQWYRYHHLFADLLRYRLQEMVPNRPVVLHKRAANWFEQQGSQEEAIDHALAAEDFDVATRLIIHSAHDLFAEGKMMMLQNWMDKLPEEFIYQRQKLFLLQALLLMRTGKFAPAITHLQHPLPEDDPINKTIQAEYFYLQGSSAYYQGDWARSLTLGQEAFDLVSSQNLALALPIQTLMAMCYEMLGQTGKACHWNQKVLHQSEQANILTATVGSLGFLSLLSAEQSDIRTSLRYFTQATQKANSQNQPQLPILGIAYIGRGLAAQYQQDWETAVIHLEKGIELCQQWGGLIAYHLKGCHTLAQVFQAMGKADAAQAMHDTAVTVAEQSHLPGWIAYQAQLMTPTSPSSPLVDPLTSREQDILRLLCNGRSAPQIADELVIGVSTVRTHIKRIYTKLDAHSRHEAIAKAESLGLV